MSYSPFDDSQSLVFQPPATPGYDTSEWDLYRQGIELTSDQYRFLGAQPKMWSGNITGYTHIVTYGQNQGSIEENTQGLGSEFLDLPAFDPVAYLRLGSSYPQPTPNEYQINEASLQPITIPMGLPTNNGNTVFHVIRGTMEGGNNFDFYPAHATNRVTQFVDFQQPINPMAFMDQQDPLIADLEVLTHPFDDTLPYSPDKMLATTNPELQRVALEGILQGDESLLPYGSRSSHAGFSCYGLGANQYGTDSVAFLGWALGS